MLYFKRSYTEVPCLPPLYRKMTGVRRKIPVITVLSIIVWNTNRMPSLKSLETETALRVLREVSENPNITQRELAGKLDISLGKINFVLNALIQKGWVKTENFIRSDNKAAYMYLLTSKGVERKVRMTYQFMKRKLAEYEALEQDIRDMEQDERCQPYLKTS